jgi:hypothetical protein
MPINRSKSIIKKQSFKRQIIVFNIIFKKIHDFKLNLQFSKISLVDETMLVGYARTIFKKIQSIKE